MMTNLGVSGSLLPTVPLGGCRMPVPGVVRNEPYSLTDSRPLSKQYMHPVRLNELQVRETQKSERK